MEPPTALAPVAITEEKIKVFRSLRPIDVDQVVRGQYEGYRHESGVAADSQTETFIALRCEVDNWRWSGVPFYLRTGKRMAEGARIISIAFREPPQSMFPAGSGVGDYGPDHLTFDLDDSSRLSLSFYGKRPGPGMTLEKMSMQFSLVEVHDEQDTLEAYERLIRDAMNGDHTLFTTAEGIERLWEASAALIEHPPDVFTYAPGSWGPGQIRDLIAPHRWRLPFERRWRQPKAEAAA
jgi:glucose-6-phosphate 1-dehydrogenase